MGIVLSEGFSKRDWPKIAGAAAEAALKSLSLGHDAFSGVASPMLRIFEGLRGTDNTEKRASKLVYETLAYAIAKTVSSAGLKRPLHQPELATLIERLLNRAKLLIEQDSIILDLDHIKNPTKFCLFDDIASQIFDELKLSEPSEPEAVVSAHFRAALSEAMVRVQVRDPDYFSPVFDVLSGPASRSDARAKAWKKYREALIKRFEDELLFGEEGTSGARLSQVYQPLRGYWEAVENASDVEKKKIESQKTRNIEMLDTSIDQWLNKDSTRDRIRLISGGPGSGKSTFAKSLAARYALKPDWQTLMIPLQRIKGAGVLEQRIDDYFRLQMDEPFDVEISPIASIGQDVHQKWLVIFDGLDELAKEGKGSETASQEFASSLADWRGRLGLSTVNFIVLGRAPSMQEACSRMGLEGDRVIHVVGMAPLPSHSVDHSKVQYIDPSQVSHVDQRIEFWRRWAVAKDLSLAPPEAFTVDQLTDLTNEPLLAYLLILSGYASDRWQEAAENRNRIYESIFDKIWDREREKPTRRNLNDLKQEGFDALLQALGLAAWRGGGRTGDEQTFVSIRDTFMRRDLLQKAKECGASELGNVALLFYTRRDEEGGAGYEFLHKSFGEYLTARGLVSAFTRWGSQVENQEADFDATEFLKRWLKLAGPSPITREIQTFLRNEVRLMSSRSNKDRPWAWARGKIEVATSLINVAVRDGVMPADWKNTWRVAEAQLRNAEECLFALLDALARTAYPAELFKMKESNGGWTAGPIKIPEFAVGDQFLRFLARLPGSFSGWMESRFISGPMSSAIIHSMLSRLKIPDHIGIIAQHFSGADFYGSDFRKCHLIGCYITGSNLTFCDFTGAVLDYSVFSHSNLTGVLFTEARLNSAYFEDIDVSSLHLTADQIKSLRQSRRGHFGAVTIGNNKKYQGQR